MWLNRGKFRANGGCGVLEKPRAMLQPTYDPFVADTYTSYSDACFLKVKILSGRHLAEASSGLISPVVELSISGMETDCVKVRTQEVESNGLNPFFNEEFEFQITMPDIACLGVTVYNVDMFGEPAPIGQRVLSIGSRSQPGLRTGFRSLSLENKYGYPLELGSILVYMSVRYGSVDLDRQTQLEKIRHLSLERDKLVEVVVVNARAGKPSSQADTRILNDLNAKIAQLERDLETDI
jgi:hypothetical protein